jgi:hypothetical protein
LADETCAPAKDADAETFVDRAGPCAAADDEATDDDDDDDGRGVLRGGFSVVKGSRG